MPFYALVNPLTGESVEVVLDLDQPIPPGLVVVELPAPHDRVTLTGIRNRGGSGEAHEAQTEQEAGRETPGKPASERREFSADQFFGHVERELTRAKDSGQHFSVLLFDLAKQDWPRAEALVKEILHECKHDLAAGDHMAPLREHLTGVLLRGINAAGARIALPRGEVTVITFPEDRKAIESLLNRRHPLLRGSRVEAA